jgi:hypothetical protein
MEIMFREPNMNACVLCGSAYKLTGEHKIKASALRQVFGDANLVVRVEGGERRPRFAQGVNSDALKFRARLCEPCNTSRTQGPDKAFEALHLRVCDLYEQRGNLDEIRAVELLVEGSDNYLNTFRYFAKILACHIAEMGAPVLEELCQFAIGKADFNPINFFVRLDYTYSRVSRDYAGAQYAAHGGVIVFGDKETRALTSFYSTLTIGPIQYCFEARLNLIGQLRLASEYPEFFSWCKTMIEEALENPLPDEELLRAGLER